MTLLDKIKAGMSDANADDLAALERAIVRGDACVAKLRTLYAKAAGKPFDAPVRLDQAAVGDALDFGCGFFAGTVERAAQADAEPFISQAEIDGLEIDRIICDDYVENVDQRQPEEVQSR